MKNKLYVIMLLGSFVNMIIAFGVMFAYVDGVFTGISETIALIYFTVSMFWGIVFVVFGEIACSAIETKRGIEA